jgi:hypothetical protein
MGIAIRNLFLSFISEVILKLTSFTGRSVLVALMAVTLAVTTARTQDQPQRRSGPRDWSHSHVIATRFGPDADQRLTRDWRTIRKHVQIDDSRVVRNHHSDILEMVRERLMPKSKPAADDSHLDWNLRTGGYGSVVGFPAKYSFDVSASNCADVIYFTVDQPGSATAVNVIAITNAYPGCPGNVGGVNPTVKWGIRMGTGTATSAVPSLDGKVLYVIESRTTANGGMILHAINVDNITTNPGVYNFGTTNWTSTHTLAAPSGTATSEQLFQLTFPTVFNNTSSPFLDYSTNQLFFGDSAGRMHRVINVNSTTASSDAAYNFQCGTAALSSPVFIDATDQLLFTSANGFMYRIATATAPLACIASQQGGSGITVGGAGSTPVIDVTNDKVLVGTNDIVGTGGRAIGTWPVLFTAGQGPTSFISLGAGSTTIAPQSPSFDDAFWSTNSGNLYAAGAPAAGAGTYLLKLPYNGNVLGAASGFATLARTGAAASVATSPVTEFLTASSLPNPDFIFVGGGSATYKFMNRIASNFAGTNAVPVPVANSFAPAEGVISGIVIDTRTTLITGSTATANIYFGTVGVAGTTQSTIVQLAQQF